MADLNMQEISGVLPRPGADLKKRLAGHVKRKGAGEEDEEWQQILAKLADASPKMVSDVSDPARRCNVMCMGCT